MDQLPSFQTSASYSIATKPRTPSVCRSDSASLRLDSESISSVTDSERTMSTVEFSILLEENRKLVVALQQLRSQHSDTQHRLETEHDRLTKALAIVDHHKAESERLQSIFEELKNQYETDTAQARKHSAELARDKSDLQRTIDTLKAEISRAGRQPPRPGSPLTPDATDGTGSTSSRNMDVSGRFNAEDLSPLREPFLAAGHPSNEIEALLQRRAHAERQNNTLKGSLNCEKRLEGGAGGDTIDRDDNVTLKTESPSIYCSDSAPLLIDTGSIFSAANSERMMSRAKSSTLSEYLPFRSTNVGSSISLVDSVRTITNHTSTPTQFASHRKRMPERLFETAQKYGSKRKESVRGAYAFWKGTSVKRVGIDDLSSDDIIIAVMGPTGSGKSTFISTISGLDIGVGHNLESRTSEISTVRLAVPDLTHGDLILVDTPEFDDSHKSDIDILKMISNWLKSTYANEIVLAGLLYFHRISDNRMAGTPLRNLRMFEEICGKNAFQNVILVTTMWDQIDEKMGEAREQELRSKYWQTMLAHNSTTSRFMRTRESAFALIEPFADTANK